LLDGDELRHVAGEAIDVGYLERQTHSASTSPSAQSTGISEGCVPEPGSLISAGRHFLPITVR